MKVARFDTSSIPAVAGSAASNAAHYEGNPSPASLEAAIRTRAQDETFRAKAAYLREHFGVVSPEHMLFVLEKLVVE
jgi:hypothetical protein